MAEIQEMSFTGFLNLLTHNVPDVITAPLIDWVMSSLYIEFGIISSLDIAHQKMTSNNLTNHRKTCKYNNVNQYKYLIL